MSLVQNERIKLTATYLNTVAAAIMITGVVAPIVALTYDLPGPRTGWRGIVVSVIWFATSVVMHSLARRLLKRLKT